VIEPTVARRIRLVGFDVDGTMTDGGVYLGLHGPTPVELKRYDIQDGLGVHLLRKAGLLVVAITGRAPGVAGLRAAELKVDDFAGDAAARKLPLFEEILLRRQVRWEEACFVGDDLPDLPLMKRVGLPIAVANASPSVKDVARWVTTKSGGRGAIREFADALLQARGQWAEVVKGYLRERGDAGP
jgi:3-deoxy-D-manno-octulosonate 8-phosphate phosphatase (KDO 8-P phosphatase)